MRSTALALLVGTALSGTLVLGAIAQTLAPESSPVPAAAATGAPPDTAGEIAAAADTADDVAMPVDVEEASVLTDDELDDLVAPIALYPDALLAQVFVASTYPLDVVKASRWADQNKDMPEGERSDAAAAEDWDASIAVLAAGFPDVIDRMADDLDETELLGDALLAQSDDVLAAVQRQRARADAMGNLTSNDAQTVTLERENIAIAPATPEVVYVPTYTEAVYTTPAPAPAVVDTTATSYPTTPYPPYPTTTTVVEDDDNTGALIATGLLSFGAGMVVNEIFDDDDDWGGYWGPSHAPIGWGGGYVRPYPSGWGDRVGNEVNIDIDRSRERNVNRERNIDRDGNWRPDRDPRRNDARNNIAERRGVREGARQRPAGDRQRPAAGGDRQRAELRQKLDAKGGGARSREQLLAHRGAASAATRPAGARQGKRQAGAKLPARQGGGKQTALSGKKGNLTSANRARDRGHNSAQRASLKKPSAARPAARKESAARPAGGGHRNVGQSGKRPAAAKRNPGGGSAFAKRGGGGGRHASAAKSRGAKSRGGGGRAGGGGGGRRR